MPRLVVFYIVSMWLSSCSDAPTQSDEVETIASVEIVAAEKRLFGVGDILALEARTLNQDGLYIRAVPVAWASEDLSVLTVDSDGVVTAQGKGSTLISATVADHIDVQRLDVVDGYVLPYPVGVGWRVIQGIGGTFSHQGSFQYSFDFVMPIGTVIIAARDGTVAQVEKSFVDYDNEPGHENFVMIDHGDGTFARYLHLTKGGARVAVGDRVAQGDTLALSGNTGLSTLPHLHFDVTQGCAFPLPSCQTIEYWFKNATPHQPEAGSQIVSEPY